MFQRQQIERFGKMKNKGKSILMTITLSPVKILQDLILLLMVWKDGIFKGSDNFIAS